MGRNIHHMFWSFFNVEEQKMIKYLLFVMGSLFCGVIGQLMLKTGMNKIGRISLLNGKIIKTLFKVFTNKFVFFGVLVFGISTIFWMFALSGLELSYAYPLISLSYILIALGSKIFFKENVGVRRWISILVIVIGVVLVSIS